METVSTIAELRRQVATWRAAGLRIALVPTMGNLHAGHIRLCTESRRHADRTVATIFVNPMQFGANEDLDKYPRTLEADQAKLSQAGVDLLFAPGMEEIYPQGAAVTTAVEVPEISEQLCGASRPGHFRGVATVVLKLFNMAQPDVALFGDKDFQQVAVIQRFVADLDVPVEIIPVPTVREPDGLAMSSRNGYLSEAERKQAPIIYQTLSEVAARIHDGERDWAALEQLGAKTLDECGFKTDYFVIRRASDLAEPETGDNELVLLVAAQLGPARLIDNIRLSLIG